MIECRYCKEDMFPLDENFTEPIIKMAIIKNDQGKSFVHAKCVKNLLKTLSDKGVISIRKGIGGSGQFAQAGRIIIMPKAEIIAHWEEVLKDPNPYKNARMRKNEADYYSD